MAAATASAIMAMSSVAGGISQANALKAQGAYERQQNVTNAGLADIQADDAEKRGEEAVREQRRQTRKLVGAQKAAAAASGVEVSSGSAGDIQDEAMLLGEADASTIRMNALREAWGLRSQAQSYRGAGEMAERTAKTQAKNTILTSGINALSYGAEGYRKSKEAKTYKDSAPGQGVKK